MGRQRGKVDPEAFAIRRELRDVLGRLVGGDRIRPGQYEQDLQQLGRRRRIALRQVLSILREERAADEVSAMEILGRLATADDAPALCRVANDPRESEIARVACALVLLGQDQAELITASDISGLVLRWQARHLAEQPRLRDPLLRLYEGASEDERLRWIALQDDEIDDHEGRAAVFEMLLEAERNPRLRLLILEFLTRHPHPCVRATLRRIEPQSPAESDFITGALAAHAAAADGISVPAGWSARIGFCDRGGGFLLRFDFRHGGERPRAAVFVLDLFRGPWESLALTGPEVARYDAADQTPSDSGEEREAELMYPISVPEALALLVDAERAAARESRGLPEDFPAARRLLDPLADLVPKPPDPLPVPLLPQATSRSALLVDLPGYRGWLYDSADRFLDDLRLEHLRRGGASQQVDDALLETAIERLREIGEPPRLSRRLRHNALVHRCAGEGEYAAIALAAAAACRTEEFGILPLVRRIVSASLHPGHYFFTPRPDLTCRRDLADLLLEDPRPTMGRVLGVDLAWILTRAVDVWLSRVPLDQRPGSDLTHRVIVRLSSAGARWVVRRLRHRSSEPPGEHATGPPRGFGRDRELLFRRYHQVLEQLRFPPPVVDPVLAELCEMLTSATETLVFGICLETCSMQCPVHPDQPGARAICDHHFPGGDSAEARIRTWPGLWLHRPSRAERRVLIASLPREESRGRNQSFECGVCHEERPPTARSRSTLLSQEGLSFPVCLRCQSRYRRDSAFREEVEHTLGPLQPGS